MGEGIRLNRHTKSLLEKEIGFRGGFEGMIN